MITHKYETIKLFCVIIKKKPVKRPCGRPITTGKGELIGVRLLPELLSAVDRYQEQVEAESRPEAIRRLIEIALKKR